MSIVTANIQSGAYSESVLVTVGAAVANGTTIVVCRGEYRLGQAVVVGGLASVAVAPLAIGDIIQASVTERGNQAGIPVRVGPNPQAATGWLKANQVTIDNGDSTPTVLSADAYASAYGEEIGSIYDPLLSGRTLLPDEYDKLPITEFGFDLATISQAGSTTVRVVPRGTEGILVGWNGATPSSPAPLTLTSSATITVAVVRDDNPGVALTRTVSITVLPALTAPSVPAPGDIVAAAYRNFGNGYIRGLINCRKSVEAQLVGFDASWKAATAREADFLEVDWVPVPPGTYTAKFRVVGETNPANYYTFLITVS